MEGGIVEEAADELKAFVVRDVSSRLLCKWATVEVVREPCLDHCRRYRSPNRYRVDGHGDFDWLQGLGCGPNGDGSWTGDRRARRLLQRDKRLQSCAAWKLAARLNKGKCTNKEKRKDKGQRSLGEGEKWRRIPRICALGSALWPHMLRHRGLGGVIASLRLQMFDLTIYHHMMHGDAGCRCWKRDSFVAEVCTGLTRRVFAFRGQ